MPKFQDGEIYIFFRSVRLYQETEIIHTLETRNLFMATRSYTAVLLLDF